MTITEKVIKRPVTTFMLFASFILVGMIAYKFLPLEYMPDMDLPFVNINIPYPGSTPEEVERQITRPVEEVLATISGVKRMISNSSDGGCFVHLRFDWGSDTELKAVEAKEKIDSIRGQLPTDVEHVFMGKESTNDMPILTLRLSSNKDLSEYYNMLNRVLKRPLERVDGVSSINMYGVDKKEIRIRLLADRLTAHRVDLGRLSEVLRRSNFVVTAGRITDSNRRFRVRPVGELKTIKDLEELIIAENNLRLKDVARISYDFPQMEHARHLDRKYAMGLDVFRESGANTVNTSNQIKAQLEIIKKDPRMEGISIYFMEDLADGIKSSLNELMKAGLVGASLAILLLLFFLRRLSTTLIVALAVPFSLLVTLAFMYFFNMSLNILSMMGLLLGVGMLVDNAVVVTESIHRYQLQASDPKEASIKGVKEVAMAISAGTLTTGVVFLPMIVAQRDEMSMYLKHVGIAFMVAIAASLILALTIVPLLASRVKLPKKETKVSMIQGLIKYYGRTLEFLLKWRKLSVVLILLILFSVAIPMSVVKKDMFPHQEDRRLRLHFNINGHYSLEKVEEVVNVVEEYLYGNQERFEIESVYTYYQGNFAQSTILLKKGDGAVKSQEEIRREMEEGMPRLAIANFTFERRRSGGAQDRLRVFLSGKSSARLVDLSRDVAKYLSNVPGLVDVRSEAEAGEQEIQVVVDRERAAAYGFSARQVATMVSVAMRGVNLRRFRDKNGEIDVRVEFQESDKQTLDHLKNLVLYDQQKRPVKLSTLADFRTRRGPERIRRENRVTSMSVAVNLKDINVADARKKVSAIMNRYRFPAGYRWSFGRSFDHDGEAEKNMMFNILMALVLIYFIMAALFESLILPAAIWTSIIFAIIGVWWFFMITGTTFSMMAWIGVLILIGVVVNNGIVLIDHINRFRENGYNRHDAIIEAGMERIRPILMTAGTTVLSLVPLCIANTQIGGDGPPYFPMARAIAGGLAFSTIVTLLVLPRIYVLLDDLRAWAKRVVGRADDLAKKPVLKKEVS